MPVPEMVIVPYQSGPSQKAPLSPSGWPKDECRYKSRKKAQEINKQNQTNTHQYISCQRL